ncbi:hypothetical protein FC756_18240 [Lysinibacillus mangiferihumi]|uniref:Uncharacterized protein n=1 Tax=Lysinibacillus mangiferihumi TaxID=1130819 RepID=A0A4V5TKH1_9BACI|nr:hypothetical protein [Lysinibacillus mangiferihumi]TKI63603.1 hypothetical protein FC756_18240 [Lysinibacillus mangiferihumi]
MMNTDYPAKLDGVLSIGSINEKNKRSSFSAIGKIDYVFNGENVQSIGFVAFSVGFVAIPEVFVALPQVLLASPS